MIVHREDFDEILRLVRPGSRVLDGRVAAAQYAIVTRKGQDAAGNAYLRKFVDEIRTEGFIKDAISKAGLRGVGVATPK